MIEPAPPDTTLTDLVGSQALAVWPLLVLALLVVLAGIAAVRIAGGSGAAFPKWRGWWWDGE